MYRAKERGRASSGFVFVVVSMSVRGHTSKCGGSTDERGKVWKSYKTTGREKGNGIQGVGVTERGERKRL